MLMKNRVIPIVVLSLVILGLTGFQDKVSHSEKTGTLKISFINTVKGKPVGLRLTEHKNPFDETYTVSKFKYYISNIGIAFNDGMYSELDSYHLIDEGKPESLSFSFRVFENDYHSISFMLGVDSIRNVSGAQTGALDPLNDMFWTWNTGYIMAKMEANSPQSKVVNKKVEYHIGGFSGVNNVLKKLTLNFPSGTSVKIKEGQTSEIIIEADLDTWWQGPNDLKIAEHPVCSTPGALARKFADNYSRMFTIKQVINN